MRVLKPTSNEQTFYIIPREYAISNVIELRDDQTNVITSYTTTMVKENDYLKFTGVFTLLEGHFYDLKLSGLPIGDYSYKIILIVEFLLLYYGLILIKIRITINFHSTI